MIDNTLVASYRDMGFEIRGQAVTYKRSTAQTFDPKTGDISPTYSSTAITYALIGPVVRGEAETRTFQIRHADLPSTPVSQRDVITYDSKDWKVRDYRYSQTKHCWFIDTIRA